MTIALAQSKSANASGVSSIALAFTSSVTAGSVLAAFVFDGGGAGQTDSATDSVQAGNWNTDKTANLAGDGDTVGLFSRVNATGGATTVTGHGTSLVGLAIHEITGAATTAPLDQKTSANATGTSASSGNITTTVANSLALACIGTSGSGDTVTHGTGWTVAETNQAGHLCTESQVLSSTTTLAGAFTLAGSDEYACIVANYAAASGGGGSPVTIAPPAGSLTLSGKVPTVTATANQLVKPPAGSLTLSGKVPTVTATQNRLVTPPAGTLTLTGLVPTIRTGSNTSVAVPAGSLTLTGKVPSIALSDNKRITPPAGSLSLTGLAPTVLITQNVLIHAPLGQLALTGLNPIVLAQVVIPVSTSPTPAGKPRKRYYVEIDSVRFDVKDAEEAREILERAKQLGNKAAQVSAETIERAHRYTAETIEPVKLEAPRIKASPELKLPLKSVRRSMNRIYRENSINLELRLWLELERRLLEDDDEAMLLLN